jgi:hypothetical protein
MMPMKYCASLIGRNQFRLNDILLIEVWGGGFGSSLRLLTTYLIDKYMFIVYEQSTQDILDRNERVDVDDHHSGAWIEKIIQFW